jgi:MFS family permease
MVAFAVLFFAFPPRVAHRDGRPTIDWLGAASMVGAVVPLLLALSWGGRDYPWASPTILALLALSGGMLAAFISIETSAKEPILPLTMFKNRVVWASASTSIIVSLAMFGTTLFIPLFIQGVIGSSASKSGAVLTPLMFGLIGASIVSGQLITKLGRYKMIAVNGLVVAAVGLFLLSTMNVSTTYSTVLTNMVIMGAGLGVTMPVFTLAVQNAVPIHQVGVATSAIQFTRSLGGSIGAAIFGAILSNRFSGAFHEALSHSSVAIAPQLVAKFENPQALLNRELMTQMSSAGPALLSQMGPLMAALREALAASMHTVFLGATIFTCLGIVTALCLVDIPLRKTNRSEAAPEGPLTAMPIIEV